MSRTSCVYRAFDADGTLLYVGQSMRPNQRIAHHKSHKTWAPLVARWTISDPMPTGDALDAEARAILTEKPFYNVAGTDVGAAFGEWQKRSTKRHLDVMTAIGDALVPEIFDGLMSSEPMRPIGERYADAVTVARNADPSITDAEVLWAIDNWYGPLGGIRLT